MEFFEAYRGQIEFSILSVFYFFSTTYSFSIHLRKTHI